MAESTNLRSDFRSKATFMVESSRDQHGQDDQGVTHAATGRSAGFGAGQPVSTAPSRWSRRDWRMAGLLALIAVVSMADLWLTLTYLKTSGMSEGNPLARWIMSMNCAWVLVAFKFTLVGFTLSVLWWARKRRSAEIAAWFGCIVMAWLCFRWDGYTQHVADVVAAEPEITETSLWMQID
jgi:hypothetical protein